MADAPAVVSAVVSAPKPPRARRGRRADAQIGQAEGARPAAPPPPAGVQGESRAGAEEAGAAQQGGRKRNRTRNRGNVGAGGEQQQKQRAAPGVSRTVPFASSLRRDADALEAIASAAAAKVEGVRSIRVAQRGFEAECEDLDALDKACLLLEDLLTRQERAQSRQSVRQRLENDLARIERELALGLRAEFPVPRECIALVLGHRGENVRRVQDELGLERIVVDKDKLVVRVVGRDAESVDAARKQLEYAVAEVPVERERFGFVVGKAGANIKDLLARSGAHSMKVDERRGVLRVVGLKRACETAQILVTSQLDGLTTNEAEREAIEDLRRRVESLASDWGDAPSMPPVVLGGHARAGRPSAGPPRGGSQRAPASAPRTAVGGSGRPPPAVAGPSVAGEGLTVTVTF